MKTIRRNVFETNSSSTHSVTIVSNDDYEKFQQHEMLYDRELNKLVTETEMYDEYYGCRKQQGDNVLDKDKFHDFLVTHRDYVINNYSSPQYDNLSFLLTPDELMDAKLVDLAKDFKSFMYDYWWFDNFGEDYNQIVEHKTIKDEPYVIIGYYGYD